MYRQQYDQNFLKWILSDFDNKMIAFVSSFALIFPSKTFSSICLHCSLTRTLFNYLEVMVKVHLFTCWKRQHGHKLNDFSTSSAINEIPHAHIHKASKLLNAQFISFLVCFLCRSDHALTWNIFSFYFQHDTNIDVFFLLSMFFFYVIYSFDVLQHDETLILLIILVIRSETASVLLHRRYGRSGDIMNAIV